MKYLYKDEKGEHLHSIEGKPLIGCSTALKVISKPLTWWASACALRPLGWSDINNKETKSKNTFSDRSKIGLDGYNKVLSVTQTGDFKKWLALLDECYYAHSKQAKDKAEAGTDAHELCEIWVKSMIKGKEVTPHVQIKPFVDWCKKNVKKYLWSELHLFSEKMWTGGICDFGYIDLNDNLGVADFKNRKVSYSSDFFQNGGYDLMLTENKGGFDKDGNKIFELTQPVKFHAVFPLLNGTGEPDISFNIQGNRRAFESALTLYKEIQFLEGK